MNMEDYIKNLEETEKLVSAYVEEAMEINPELITNVIMELLFIPSNKHEQYVKDFIEYLDDLGLERK